MTKTPKDKNKYSESDELGREELLDWLDKFYRETRMYPYPPRERQELTQAYQQIKEMIQKKPVTEEFTEEKAKELITMIANLYPYEGSPCVVPKSKAKDFIRKIAEDIQEK